MIVPSTSQYWCTATCVTAQLQHQWQPGIVVPEHPCGELWRSRHANDGQTLPHKSLTGHHRIVLQIGNPQATSLLAQRYKQCSLILCHSISILQSCNTVWCVQSALWNTSEIQSTNQGKCLQTKFVTYWEGAAAKLRCLLLVSQTPACFIRCRNTEIVMVHSHASRPLSSAG